jgi:hypothetical protein
LPSHRFTAEPGKRIIEMKGHFTLVAILAISLVASPLQAKICTRIITTPPPTSEEPSIEIPTGFFPPGQIFIPSEAPPTEEPPTEEPPSQEPPSVEVCVVNPDYSCPNWLDYIPVCCPWQVLDDYTIVKIYRKNGVVIYRNETILYCCD